MIRCGSMFRWLSAVMLVGVSGCSWASVGEAGSREISIAAQTVVFDGEQGWEKDGVTYRLACGPILAECGNGDLLCTWLSGSDKEPATDNCILMSRSSDGGKTWSSPRILVPAGSMAGALTNMHRTKDGRLVAFGAYWPSEDEYTVWHYFKIESEDHGQTWSVPQPFEIHNTHGFIGAGPVVLANGECLYVGSFFDKRQAPLTGSVLELATVQTEAEAALLKAVEPDSKLHPGKFGRHLHGCCVFVAEDEASTHFAEYGYIGNRPLGLLEPTAVQLDGGRIVMLMRAEWGGFLWRSDSDDQGRTWTPAQPTEIPNPTSLACLVDLGDGRVGLLHNPSGGVAGKRGPRSPLSLWISEDGMKSWSMKKDLFSGGQLAYPNGIMTGKDLVFAFDKNRREIIFVKVKL